MDSPLKIDYVSPLPPIRSGISDYSVDLFPELESRCDLRLIRLPGQEVDAAVRGRWPVVEADQLGADGRLPLYHMGNNHHHEAVWDLAQSKPGVLVLHDLVLHHFLIERTVKYGHFEAYREALETAHGWVGDAAGRPIRWPGAVGNAAQFALPAHRELLIRQKGILTHSPWSADFLAEEIPGLRVRSLSMGVPLPAEADRGLGQDFKRRYGLPLESPIIGSFGFQTPMKRTESAVRALAEPGLEQAHLMVAGEVAPILELEDLAQEIGVRDRVHVLGFLPFEDFEAGISAADVALNLRYPTAGETSASLLRILAVGRPVLVSDHAQSADLPDDVVIKVPLGDDEPKSLARQLAEMLAQPQRLREMGQRARQHVETHHRPADAAQAMIDACREWAQLDPPNLPTEPDVPAPTSLIWHRLEGCIEVLGAEGPWPPGERRNLEIRLKNTSAARWLAGEAAAGGLALEVQLWVDDNDLFVDRPWMGLPFDLEPGERHVFELPLRRPLAADVRLEIIPHALGHASFARLEGPTWTANL